MITPVHETAVDGGRMSSVTSPLWRGESPVPKLS